MPCKRLQKYLDENSVKFELCRHSRAFTSQEIASRIHTKGRMFAKTVILTLDGLPAMVVLPASELVDLESVRKSVGAKRVFLATETEFRDMFPDCEVGAMPPFGNLYGMEVYVAEVFPKSGTISFNAGTHSEVMKMSVEDFVRLVKPVRIKLAWQPLFTG